MIILLYVTYYIIFCRLILSFYSKQMCLFLLSPHKSLTCLLSVQALQIEPICCWYLGTTGIFMSSKTTRLLQECSGLVETSQRAEIQRLNEPSLNLWRESRVCSWFKWSSKRTRRSKQNIKNKSIVGGQKTKTQISWSMKAAADFIWIIHLLQHSIHIHSYLFTSIHKSCLNCC